jgi:hypothetical protein
MSYGMTSSRRFHPGRALVGLTAAAAPAALAVALRNRYDWEETDAILDLVGACAVAGALGGLAGAVLGRRVTRALVWALAAAGLVIPLLVVYYLALMVTTPDYS